MAQESQDKEKRISAAAKREREISDFWKEKGIFETSLKIAAPKGEFVFYDGPPFATGLPHYGSLLSSIVKDVIPRYKTMRGYHVRRRWGWDCHGLPIENMIEKELGLKAKKQIEELGIATFNEACRDSVLRYADGWKEYIDRIGRWVEYDNAYKTMDNTYMESVWWALKKMYDKKLLYEGRKVLLYCPHCETPLAKAEIQQDNSYKDVTEEAVTVKLKVKEPEKHGLPENTYLLAWTTTPWTLPGNVALAVGSDILYGLTEKDGETLIRAFVQEQTGDGKHLKAIKGKDLIGIEYEPLYEVEKVKQSGKKAWYVADADFVTTDEGTGIVHTAVIYGEDDYKLGQEKDLPMVPLLNAGGMFNDDAPELVRGMYFKKAEKCISDDLEERGLLFARDNHTHSYPHCHRCDTPLLYNAITSWFINIQKVKHRLIRLNEKVSWFPEHLKHGRFLNIVKDAPDWTISRNRYWASPLPIWKCRECPEIKVLGSLEELKEQVQTSGNTYLVMRHGKALSNQSHQVNYRADTNDPLTKNGLERVREACKRMQKGDIDLIIASPIHRTKQTAEIVAKHLELKEEQFLIDNRLQELQVGKFQGHTWDDYHKELTPEEQFTKPLEGGETRREVKTRVGDLLYELEHTHKGKKILLVTHEGVFEAMRAVAEGADLERSIELVKGDSIQYAEIKEIELQVLPHNAYYELDLHRPYIDDILLTCGCGESMKRIPEVVDGWVESGSMPFAEYHYPFENRRTFKKRSPGDFVAEYVAQTRTWFYYMHAIAGILFRKPSFKNVVTTGNILAEDGSKMSKSKGNYTDPLKNLDQYGADALRYYLMGSTVMQGEDVRFLDEELRESHNRVINILANVLSFYELYAPEEKEDARGVSESPHVLDRWIRARLSELTAAVTEYLDQYDTVRTARDIRAFIEDLSTWYVRRSRDRFKSDDISDRTHAMTTTRMVLLETAKVAAPLIPFIAEKIYQTAGGQLESVHLETWPKVKRLSGRDTELLKHMKTVRDIVSSGLEARSRAGIKVRQPLQTLFISINIPDEYIFLIRDEVNVKAVKEDTEMVEHVRLDTNITPELQAEGNVRDFIRHVQGLRKEMNLQQNQMVKLAIDTDEAGKAFIEQFAEDIKQAASLEEVCFTSIQEGMSVAIGEQQFVLSI